MKKRNVVLSILVAFFAALYFVFTFDFSDYPTEPKALLAHIARVDVGKIKSKKRGDSDIYFYKDGSLHYFAAYMEDGKTILVERMTFNGTTGFGPVDSAKYKNGKNIKNWRYEKASLLNERK